jgi:hypothetical protein
MTPGRLHGKNRTDRTKSMQQKPDSPKKGLSSSSMRSAERKKKKRKRRRKRRNPNSRISLLTDQ